jgi:integrase
VRYRERRQSHLPSKSGTRKWAEDREKEILAAYKAAKDAPPPVDVPPVPTLEEFAPQFLELAEANRDKPSSLASKRSLLRVHLVPLLGAKRLDTVSKADVEQLKVALHHRSAKTTNTVLTVLSRLLRSARAEGLITSLPEIKLLKTEERESSFYTFEEFERMMAAAVSPEERLILLLGADAGLRMGEMLALRWTDCDLDRRRITVQRSIWRGHETATKSGRIRRVPMTSKLYAALCSHPRKSLRVLGDPGKRFIQRTVERICRAAGTPLLL